MNERLIERERTVRDFFGLGAGVPLTGDEAKPPETDAGIDGGRAHFNIEWHVIPSERVVPLDDDYFSRLYRSAPREFGEPREHKPALRSALAAGHRHHQGRVIGVETTAKPRYLPRNRQFYGTTYGHDPHRDPLAPYMGRAGMMNGTRYEHDYLSLREFLHVVNDDWSARGLLPGGYRATVCPPVVFNLVGTIFHPEWAETESLELGFYLDREGNATCYAVGPNAPGDFSFVAEVESEGDWSLTGFRLALVPE